MKKQRQLAAILYADVAGFSSLIHADISLQGDVRSRLNKCFSEQHQKHDGIHLEQFGDSTIAIFPSAAAATECAIAIQLELMQNPSIPLRIGIHSGEIIHDERGVFGAGLKIASRIERRGVPGSILLSEKIYDDVRNHPWISTIFLEEAILEDMNDSTRIYAISNRGFTIPNRQPSFVAESSDGHEVPIGIQPAVGGGKKKIVAAFLALFFGSLGLHRFYLGQRWKGTLYAAAFAFLMLISIAEDAPIVLFTLILAWVDAILFFVMPKRDFNRRFNPELEPHAVAKSRKKTKKPTRDTALYHIKRGLKKFEANRYRKAIDHFDTALDKNPNHHLAHYYLARCFSLLQEGDHAIFHLEQAVANGFQEWHQIEKDYALKSLRNDPRYHEICSNYFPTGMPKKLPQPKADLLSGSQISVFDQLEVLGDQLKEGLMSPQQFEAEKARLLP